MKRKVSQLRLSPNEEARLIREEHERRRKLRIQQVREQQRYIALQIRREVELRRRRELEQLKEELRDDWERQQREKLNTLQKLYQESLQLLGQGHRSAKENEPDLAAIAQREEENHSKAEERYREALNELKSQRLKDQERQSRSINARKKALQAEKERAAKVASLPPPPPNPIQNIDSKKPHVVKKSDVSAFAATHYHMPESTVDREADPTQPNAHEEAELEARRMQDLQREEKQRREEQLEKARLRGKQALRREHLVQDRERLLLELEHMQQTDLLRRRQQVSHMPAQIFQPLYKRQEMREDFQREMEFAFEDMYTGERRVKGDLVVQLVPEPLPALSTGSQDQDQELDITLDEIPTPAAENTHHDTEQEAGSPEQEASARETSRPAPRRALKKLLDRIRSQRTHWSEHNGHVPAADSPTAFTNQIPEHDTTIDTGSLTSEEKDKLPEPARSPPAVSETTEPSAEAETSAPVRLQEFTDERRKRELELEQEKQQQVVLIQELEEQKAKLEQMLFEAQQEREHLKAAVTQEVPVLDQEVTSVSSGLSSELVPPPGEDEHSRRIREYQQRLLEQNRIHQRSVEVARQRLEEYQRALQIRYSMTTKQSLPSVVPPGLVHPPLHSTGPVHLPAPPSLPTTPAVPAYVPARPHPSVEVTTREADMVASPPHLPGSSLRVCSRLLPDEVESVWNRAKNQKPDVSTWLTDNIMERVTEHLPDSVKPVSVTMKPPPHKLSTTRESTSILLQPTSHPIQVIGPSIADRTPLFPGHVAVKPHVSLLTGTLSSREDDMERQRRELQRQQEEEEEEERQRWELQEVQRRLLEQREAVEVQQRQKEEERQRQELQRRMQEQRAAVELQQKQQEEERQRRLLEQREAMEVQQRQTEEEKQRRELQEVQRRLLEQREAVELQKKQQEEERQRREVEMEEMRRQKETLQALIHTDAQPGAEVSSEVPLSESIGPTRRQLLASLLRAIQETNGGTLSHLEEPQEEDDSPQQPSSSYSVETDPVFQSSVPAGPLPASGLLPPPRAAKPPVTRVRLGVMKMMTEQHELSAIQEVETPVNSSLVTGLEDSVKLPSQTVGWDPQEESDSSVSSDRTLQTPSWSSSEQRPAERREASSRRYSHLDLLMEAGTSPESSESSDSVVRKTSRLSSDSGRGADYSGPAITSYRSFTESAQRPPDSDCLSSTTISSGSYITTDPEQNEPNVNTDKSLPIRRHVEPDGGANSLNVSSPSGQNFSMNSSTAARPALDVDSLFGDSSIQRIIDRYTRELNFSLSTTGRAADSEGSHVDDPGSVSQQSLVRVSERSRCLPSDAAAAQRSVQEWDNTVDPILEHFSVEGTEQDSFRPLIGRLADQSSCLAVDHRDSTMEQLVGQPSAHSSMIGQLPGLPVGLDQGGWDSTLSRMIGRLSHQSSPHWLSGGHDFYAGQMVSERSATWLDEESRMRPLVGELDESTGHHSGSSGERTRVDPDVSTEASVPSFPALPPEASSHSASDPAVNPHPQDQNQTSPMDLGPERTEDSFHLLVAEVTHNETAEPSVNFHAVPDSPEGRPASCEQSASAPPEEFETHNDPSIESELSPERLRTDKPPSCLTPPHALHESFSQLITSQHHPHEVELTALSLSNLTMCDDALTLKLQPEEPFRELESEQTVRPASEKLSEAGGEKGILEQSEITLVSLTDTTLQDQETTITDEDGVWDGKHPDRVMEEGQKETEESHSVEQTPEDENQTPPVTFLEFQWGPSQDLQQVYQQKRQALLQRSSHRVEEIKSRRDGPKVQPEVQAPPREQSKAKDSQPVSCKSKTKTEPQPKTNTKSEGGRAEQQTSDKSGFKQKKVQCRPSVSDCRLKICTPEQRKLDVTEMHQRTQRLYEQLEEVKHQKAARSRQEASAENRLKAKEFHKKTLQKLRAKTTRQ
ncbi:centrosomal protein of 295 kDa isoform X2 [Larimichthys crocea]|uniref:centrosomal protein of 295 kDa isoform X2 n=1 Tax=Larimichthys crocea TaxID=215358 RepID=UPI000F5DEE01|nr:centrosomal protein of 295 kDa isoform X2 [Larimichthys crocea]